MYEKYDLTSEIGVKRVLDDYHNLIELRYKNLEVVEFLVDFFNLVRLSKLDKLEKMIMNNIFYKCMYVKGVAAELNIDCEEVREKINDVLTKISNTYKKLEGVEDEMKTYVFLDLETTGLNPEIDQVIEIGALKTDKEGKEIGRFTTFVTLNKENKLTKEIEELTGISNDDLKTGMLEQLALQALDCFIGDSIVVAHNASFDLSFLSRNKKYIPVEKFICTKTMSALSGLKSTSLESVSEKFGVKNKNPHRAFSDVVTMKKVFFKLKRHKLTDKEYMNTIIDFYNNNFLINGNTKVIKQKYVYEVY